jgi:hypothetical protein
MKKVALNIIVFPFKVFIFILYMLIALFIAIYLFYEEVILGNDFINRQ